MSTVKQLLKAVVPSSLQRMRKQWNQTRAQDAVTRMRRQGGGRVLTGPFRGMQYIDAARGSAYPPKIAGIYELELHALLDNLAKVPYTRIIDIGAAEGYYAVGMALMFPAAQIIAYEMQAESRQLLESLARLNGTNDRLKILEECTAASLAGELSSTEKTLLVVDIDGGEDSLFSRPMVDHLKHADLIIETHDFAVPHITRTLRDRFEVSHIVKIIPFRRRRLSNWPREISGVPWNCRLPAMAEHRPAGQAWLWMESRLNSTH